MPRLKVKDMPRQQQKAVKASMAEQAAMKMVKKRKVTSQEKLQKVRVVTLEQSKRVLG